MRYKETLAQFLDVPTGKHLRLLRHAACNLDRVPTPETTLSTRPMQQLATIQDTESYSLAALRKRVDQARARYAAKQRRESSPLNAFRKQLVDRVRVRHAAKQQKEHCPSESKSAEPTLSTLPMQQSTAIQDTESSSLAALRKRVDEKLARYATQQRRSDHGSTSAADVAEDLDNFSPSEPDHVSFLERGDEKPKDGDEVEFDEATDQA